MKPIVNPYRDQESGLINDVGFKAKVKKPSPICGYRVVVLFVLVVIICGSYYLHLRFYTTSIRDNPSIRGSINTYKSFSQSIRDLPKQLQHDLANVDEQKNPPRPPIDLKKPTKVAEDPKSNKINTFRTESEKHIAASIKTPVKAKPLEPISPEIASRIEIESQNAKGVEDKVQALADTERLRKQREKEEVLERQRLQEQQKQREEQERLQAEQRQRDDKERQQAEQKKREENERVKAEARWRVEQQLAAAKREEEKLAKARLAEREAAAIAAGVPERAAPASIPEKPAAEAMKEPAVELPAPPAEAAPVEKVAAIAVPEAVPEEAPEMAAAVVAEKVNAVAEAVEHSAEKVDMLPPADLPQTHEHASVGGEEQNTEEKDALHPAHVLPLQVPPPVDPALGDGTGKNAPPAQAAVVERNPEFPHEEDPHHVQAAQELEHNSPPVEAILKQAQQAPDVIPTGVAESQVQVPPVAVGQQAGNAGNADIGGNAAESPKRPTGFDLPAAIKPITASAGDAAAAALAAAAAGAVSAEKVDYCAGHVDPFQATPVDTFEPPAGAGFEEALQWRSAVKAMISKISKVKYGGEELRALMKGEVEALRVMRFKMFCKYA